MPCELWRFSKISTSKILNFSKLGL